MTATTAAMMTMFYAHHLLDSQTPASVDEVKEKTNVLKIYIYMLLVVHQLTAAALPYGITQNEKHMNYLFTLAVLMCEMDALSRSPFASCRITGFYRACIHECWLWAKIE